MQKLFVHKDGMCSCLCQLVAGNLCAVLGRGAPSSFSTAPHDKSSTADALEFTRHRRSSILFLQARRFISTCGMHATRT